MSEQTGAATSPVIPPAEPESDAADRTPFTAAAKVVKHVQLAAIHFGDFSARAMDAEAIPEEEKIAASTVFLKPTCSRSGEGFSTKTLLNFQMKGSGDGAKLYAVASATLEATYTLKPEAPSFEDEDLDDFALCYCPFHVWGYWREFVQSSLARLDLPQVTVPLFLIAQAPQMVRDKLD